MKRKLFLFLWISWAFFSFFLVLKSFEPEAKISPVVLEDNLRLMTWNLGNYCLSSRKVGEKYYKNSPKPNTQRKEIAKTIKEISPDVICIQEIGANYLSLFLMELKNVGEEYPYSVLLENLDKNRCLAVVSKIPFGQIKKYADIKFPYEDGIFESTRGCLLVQVQDIYISTLHAKSRRAFEKYPHDKTSASFRERELESIAKVLAKYKGKKLILSGDFNEESSHENIKNFEAISNLMIVPQGDSSGKSWTYSYRSGKALNSFDFFLSSPSLNIKKPARVHSNYKEASDHRPVYVDISLKDISKN